MHQNRLISIILLFIVLYFTSCKLEPVDLKNIGSFEVLGIEENSAVIKVTATVNNPNQKIKIKNAEVFVYVNNKELGKITQLDKIVLQGKSTQNYSARLRIELTGSKGGMFMALTTLNNTKKNLKISGKARISMPLYWKNFSIKDYPVKL